VTINLLRGIWMKIKSTETRSKYYMIKCSSGYVVDIHKYEAIVAGRIENGTSYSFNKAKEVMRKLDDGFQIVLIELKEYDLVYMD
jgi:hypothetical protein